MSVARIWRRHGLQPHRLRHFMASNDPAFEAKATDIIGLYLAPPAHAAVFRVDEKTAIQALDRLDPVLPLSPGRAERPARFSRYSGLSRRSMMRYHDRIVCALAGLQAQRRVDRQSVRSSDGNGDEAIASELLLRLHGEERERICAFRYLQARARNLVSNQWPLIEDLAEGLLKYQSLTGKEIADILQASRYAEIQEGSSP